MKIYTLNPATEEKISGYEFFTSKKLNSVVDNSKKAFDKWRKYLINHRLSLISHISKGLLKNKNKFAKLITQEMGKPIKESIAEVEKCSWLCDYFVQNAERFLEEEKINTEHKYGYIRFDPLGKILCVMPWNFPFWQVFRFAVPVLCTGNTVILKHSSITLGCSLEIEKLFNEYLDKNVFQTVITDGKGVNYLMDKIEGVSLTGSVETGKIVAENAAKRIKPFVLELGGSDPFIVLKDANIKNASSQAIKGRFLNSGQSCIAAKRFIIAKEKYDEFNELVLNSIKKLKVGDPMKITTDIGPLARKEFLIKLDKQVKDSIKQGAKLLYGGNKINGKGYFFNSTMLSTKNNTRIFKEETFGPVFASMKVNNDFEAIKEANNTQFGLGASLWTKDLKKGMEYAKEIESGVVFINGFVKSDPRLPFGGVKNSGIGRELSRYGLLEFCNIKSVVAD